MNVTLETDGVYFQTDSNENKIMLQQGINNSLSFSENTGTATFLKSPTHPTPATSANDTQSATTEYVRAYCQTLNIGSTPITDQSLMISGIKASTLSLDQQLATTSSPLTTTDVIFTAIYLTEGIQFSAYNIIATTTNAVPLRFALFNPSGDYVTNSDTGGYNLTTTTAGGILTSTLATPVNITTSGVYYIFYQANTSVPLGRMYSSVSKTYSNILNFSRTGTISSGGPFRTMYINGASASIIPSEYGNIGSITMTGGLALINVVFLT